MDKTQEEKTIEELETKIKDLETIKTELKSTLDPIVIESAEKKIRNYMDQTKNLTIEVTTEIVQTVSNLSEAPTSVPTTTTDLITTLIDHTEPETISAV